ncbi:VMAP-C domain-containing protein [Streptomyces flavofungini]|uniref:Trypsin-like peptidase domain-containing protein n=1 Tax=Streptomyces flavofungini TaxID=68200 RepID=A0ABS0XCI3_9ACTN|nr:trypsin-like peptidase domain-containing protein [Streptomyces flavofungini]MBJ3810925.1 trypsin-like peptidase domain-containing protein [Streptomyces flavofungini]GHC41383.1 serine protease [Streptomyces flavofungini]
MSSTAWHARVECGRETGAGFLVSERHVLTCAHVVRDSAAAGVAVSFPHRRELGAVAAVVGAHGGWSGRDDHSGDLAVLELDRAVPIPPAGFAAPDDAYLEPRPRLVAYGFPRGYAEGTIAEYRATAAQLIADEWVQLEAWSAHGQPLAPGFSGAAVTLADSGLVVGMVSAVAGAAGVRNGRMLPAPVMARYWPRLAELIPVPGRGRTARHRLRALVADAEKAGPAAGRSAAAAWAPERLYLDAVGPLGPPVPPGGFTSLWSAAWYVLSEVDVPGAVERFADRLAGLAAGGGAEAGESGEAGGGAELPDSREVGAYALRDAARGRDGRTPEVPGAAAAPEPPSARHRPGRAPSPWSPILVELARSGAGDDQVLVEVSACRDGHRHPVGARTLAKGRVRPYVQELIDEAFGQLAPDAEELITFVLPREWLNEPVARWERSADDPTPLGCSYPLVVTDRARRAGGLRHQLTRTWERLDGKSTTVVHRVGCTDGEQPNKLRFRLRSGDVDLAGFASPPKAARVKQHFEVSLNAPAPVLLWARVGCEHEGRGTAAGTGGGGDTGPADRTTAAAPDADGTAAAPPCPGAAFLDQLAAHLSLLPPAELPRHVLALRESADAADEPELHWARDIQLLWDDPRCFPDAAAAPLHSPVT